MLHVAGILNIIGLFVLYNKQKIQLPKRQKGSPAITMNATKSIEGVEYHQSQLQRCCRVCGQYVERYRQAYRCQSSEVFQKIRQVFSADVTFDKPEVHPQRLCFGCWSSILKKGNNPRRSLTTIPFKWEPHAASSCKMCDMFQLKQKGGKRKKKGNEGKGRPPKKMKYIQNDQIKCSNANSVAIIPPDIAPKLLIPGPMPETDRFLDLSEELICAICKNILQQPVQGPCEHCFCWSCLEQCFVYTYPAESPCPVCKYPLTAKSITCASRLLQNMLAAALVMCKVCKNGVTLELLDSHERSCTSYRIQSKDSLHAVDKVLEAPLDKPLDKVEKKLATHLVKRIIASNNSNLIKLETGGTPLHVQVVPLGRKSTNNPSTRTLQRRATSVGSTRELTCRNSKEQVQKVHALEMKRLGEEERAAIAREAGLGSNITPGEGLAMKASLGLPWNKIRHLRRQVNFH